MQLLRQAYERFASLFHELAKFGTVGAAAFVIDFGGTNLARYVLELGPLTSKVIATVIAATFAYLADVFVLPAHRGRGHGRALVAAMMAHPDLQGLRRLMLATSDAHDLYAGFGFEPARPGKLMEIVRPDPYRTAPAAA